MGLKGILQDAVSLFCCKKMKPNSSQWRIDRKFEQMGFGRMDEKRLLKKLRNGDEKALAKIIDIYSAYISKIVGSLISSKGTREDIEEVVADTFIALWRTADRINYEKYSSIKAYIAVIARNKTKDWLRNRGQDLQLMDDVLLIDNSLEQLIVQREQQRILADALKQLNLLDCKIFVAYYYQYKKVKEIAHEFEMNPQTVKTRLRRGRAMLKKILIKEGYGNNEN